MSETAYLSVHRDGTFEAQFSSIDDVDRLIVVCGRCKRGLKDTPECTGYRLSDASAQQIFGGKKILLDATDLATLAALLYKYDVPCFEIDYYAVVRISTSSMIAEHYLNLSGGRPLNHETPESSCGRIRTCNYS